MASSTTRGQLRTTGVDHRSRGELSSNQSGPFHAPVSASVDSKSMLSSESTHIPFCLRVARFIGHPLKGNKKGAISRRRILYRQSSQPLSTRTPIFLQDFKPNKPSCFSLGRCKVDDLDRRYPSPSCVCVARFIGCSLKANRKVQHFDDGDFVSS